jgi:putative redox protein
LTTFTSPRGGSDAVEDKLPLAFMTVRLTAYWEGGYRCRVPIRDFELVSDEPPESGGADAGPMPTELLVASLATCFAAAIYHAARKRDITLPDLDVTVDADYTGTRLSALRVEVRSSMAREQLQPLVERARSYCYVSNTLLNTPRLDVVMVD